MGVSMDQINAGVLSASKVLGGAMDMWDRVAKSTGLLPTGTGGIVATPQTATPAVTPTAQTTQSKPTGFQISGTMLLLGGLAMAVLLWRKR